MDRSFTPLAVIFAFSTLTESIIEYLFGSMVSLRSYLPLIGLGIAVILTFLYQVNIFSLVLGIESSSPFLDFLLSGLLISRVSNFINDFAQKILGSK